MSEKKEKKSCEECKLWVQFDITKTEEGHTLGYCHYNPQKINTWSVHWCSQFERVIK